MSRHFYREFDPLLDAEQAAEMVRLCADFGSYHPYSEEGLNEGLGEGLPQRFDAAFNFMRSGGRFARKDEDRRQLASRTNYFRETYAYGTEISAPGIESFYHHEGLKEAARLVFDRPLIEPAIVYANLLLPGQELAVHTDVPEFRGVSRKTHPQWLLVVMHHSALFESWRMPIATAVSWFHDAEGGEFAFYPDGSDAPGRTHEVAFNTAVLLDTDSVFHGVDRVRESVAPLPSVGADASLRAESDGRWRLRDREKVVADYRWDEMRFSVSWKAYCFRDEAERDAWRGHGDDLRLPRILDTLRADLHERGRLESEPSNNRELAELLVDEYIHFPAPEGERARS